MRDSKPQRPRQQQGKIDIAVDGTLGWMIFDNPDRLNALTQTMWQDIPGKMAALEKDKAVRVIILAGRGEKAFCAGADISEFDMVRKDAATARNYEKLNVEAFAAIRNCRKPVIAMIEGYCFGGGFGIAAATDIRFASENATFSVPAARLGLAYPVEALADIVQAVGEQFAKEILYCANKHSAAEMLAKGFLLKTCEGDTLADEVRQFALQIAELAPATITAAKLAMLGLRSGDLSEADAASAATFNSSDYREGRAAFRERRNPAFRGE